MTCDIPGWAISIYYTLALPFAFVAAYIILLVEHDESLKSDPSWLKWARFLASSLSLARYVFLICIQNI
jgi:hypothetical protein